MAIDIIKERARWLGFPPDVAAAVATLESGGRPDALGDATDDPRGDIDPVTGKRWASLGAFQENVAGGAGETFLRRGGTIAGLFDPVTATDRFVDRYRGQADVAFLGETPGQIAARAQRPANPTAYAAAVDSLIARMDGAPPPPRIALRPGGVDPGATSIVASTEPASPATTGSPATSCPQLNVAQVAWIGLRLNFGASPADLAREFNTTVACLQQSVYGAAKDLPDPGGDIARGIKEGVLGALPTVAILVVVLLLAYKGVAKTIEV